MLRRLPLFAALILCSTADAAESQKQQSELGIKVSLTQLIAAPDAYDGKVVSVSGFAYIEFENNNLCAAPEPGASRACIWINYFDGPVKTDADFARYQKISKKWSKYNRRHISLRGIFDASDTGHLGGSSGGIGHITKVSVSSTHSR